MTINPSLLRALATAAAAAACGMLMTGCDRDGKAAAHTTVATQHGAKITATLDGKTLDVPGPYTCATVTGMSTAVSAPMKLPSVLVALKQGTTDVDMVTISLEHNKPNTWSSGASGKKGSATATRSGDTFTVTGELSDAAFSSSAALHPFTVEVTCPGGK
ncbi:MAG: lipoprotein LpqH [Segniliparus sp.]|uniref:lipoprotein LpqH n=1 Tax=Segniliparus sp. TaxID=2804064 RepID=UPI003F35458C